MNDQQREKIKRFMADKVMSQAVHDAIVHSFVKSKVPDDVHVLAAKSLSFNLLEDAWRELARVAPEPPKEPQGVNSAL